MKKSLRAAFALALVAAAAIGASLVGAASTDIDSQIATRATIVGVGRA